MREKQHITNMELSEEDIQYLRIAWKMGRRQSVFQKYGCGLGKKYDLPELEGDNSPESLSESTEVKKEDL